VKVLSIGNSFSQDAHKYLHKLAASNGLEINTVNLYIGGCTLEQHWQSITADRAEYDLEYDGGEAVGKISIQQALISDHYDIVTLQQASHLSGIQESYDPYITNLAAFVRKYQPLAKLYFHQTWTYEKFTEPSPYGNYYRQVFANYDFDQEKMYQQLTDCACVAAVQINAKLIPVGTLIHKLRETTPEFSQNTGGRPLSRDGYHLSLDYGRFAAAAMWLYKLTGVLPKAGPFEDFDPALLKVIIDTILEIQI